MSPTGSVRRFDTTRFNVLKQAGRDVAHESLSAGSIGRNGLHRFDSTPGEPEQYAPRDYYLAELQKKKGTTNFTEGGLFIVKGLHNFSNLPSGDSRVLRTSSTSREQFLHPDQRAHVPPHFSHLQASEPSDSDGAIGPASVASANAVEEAAEIRAHRARYYRDKIEHVKPPDKLEKLEVMLRDKLEQYAGGHTGFAFKNTFRFFDREARGVIDFAGFKNALENMGLTLNEYEEVALFARYDTKRKGYLSYQEFTAHLLAPSVSVTKSEALQLSRKVELLCSHFKRTGSFEGIEPPTAIHETSEMNDEEFLEHQRLKSIFFDLDNNNNGSIDFSQFRRMLRAIGVNAASPIEVQAMFDYIDSNHSRDISFDEFAAFCLSTPFLS